MNTGSLVLITEDLGLSFYQYHGLGRALGLSKDTIEFLHKWTIKCESCGRHFSPKLNTPNRIKKCYFCRKTWRQEYHRKYFYKRNQYKGGPTKKAFTIYTGSYI